MAEASGQVVDAGSQVAVGAVELASLGEAFGAAVGRFGDSNAALVGQLAQVEAALARSQQRSAWQLAGFVARQSVDQAQRARQEHRIDLVTQGSHQSRDIARRRHDECRDALDTA